jgi:hypothetical protein
MPSWYSHLLPVLIRHQHQHREHAGNVQHHVDYYLALFDRLTRRSGEIYLSNARDYVFKGNWNIPKNWETVFLHNTPRSWSPDHPTHILRKGDGDFSLQRRIAEGSFNQQIISWHKQQLVSEQKLNIADRDRICFDLQQTIADLQKALAIAKADVVYWD